jgi:hypothetical protein
MNFLQKLQSAPEPTKRRWIMAITAVVMVAVIYVWLAYFNSLITAGFSQPAIPSVNSGQVPAEPAPSAGVGSASFWQKLKNATANLYNVFGGALHNLGNILDAPREYIIKPPQ